ncbi:CLIP domain-containing serine protease C9 [Lepeophtheirus salmonis]|uniref:CLIP domain-containing serine protease C9 n=1 Tax=Lepeophtheirus salmonis TaxID=72036 RepID=UPI001AE747B2|nr:serine protease persephone-like [Lepeophtheirus salmonis]
MIKSCMKSCGICGNKGCVDEFDKCDYWSRKGHCVDSPEFMSINCRESCGVCGFRSIRNNEEQLVNGREYSNLEHSKFFCGRSKLKRSSDVPTKDNDKLQTNIDDDDIIRDIFESRKKRDLPELQDSGEFFYYKTEEENSNRRIICAATTISDRFIISAAHCYINFRGSTLSRINSMIIRDDTNHTEEIEMKRIFIYPSFQLPSLYNDIAVIELGRRIKFDYDTYGDSPSCLGRTEDTLVGQEAISQGYGFTEDKVTSDILLQSFNNIISNRDCADFLSHNSSSHINYQTRLKRALINGINEQLVCTMGQRNETSGVYSGPCEGDSGGPLYVKNDEIQSLAGIVSGGLGCGLNIPKWYTRISSYIPWIKCIISNAKRYASQSRVEFACRPFLKRFTPKNLLYT